MTHRIALASVLLSGMLFAACAPRPVVVEEAPPAPLPVQEVVRPEVPGLDSALLAEPLGLDPAVRTGTLDNGLTYFIRQNPEPQTRAELRLVVNAGSTLEDEDQRGLAHLLEHMAFNGTERFPELELVNYLERIGMRFGPDLNAYTSFDETVYFLQVPTDERELLETGFVVLREWAGSITLDTDEIDAERGVVLEEWRQGRGAGARIRDQQFPVLFAGSRYAERLPIGLPEVIQHTPADAVRRYYHDWYRPALMAVIAVGDLDLDDIEALIRATFSDLENPAGAPERTTFDVPPHDDTRFAIATDPEQTMTLVQLLRKMPATTTETVYDFRESIIDRLYLQMVNARLRELAQQPGAPFLGGSALQGGFVRPVEAVGMSAAVQEGGVSRALEALLTEAARVRQHGFTVGEMERAAANLERSYRRAFEERNTTPSRSLASAYTSHYLQKAPVPGIEREYELVQLLLPSITLAEVERRADAVTGEDNRVVLVSAPRKEGGPEVTEAELRAVIASVENLTVEAYEDAYVEAPLVSFVPPAGSIVLESRYEEDGIVEWRLSNGARVVVVQTDFRNDEVLFSAFAPGGLSVVEDDQFRIAEQAAAAVRAGGVGEFSTTDLERRLAGQAVNVFPYIAAREQGLGGQASPEDLETMLQLVHLYFTAPRRDEAAFEAYRERMLAALENRSANPTTAFSDTLSAVLSGYHPRSMPQTKADIATADLDEAIAEYRERFRDADQFTFLFAGAVDPAVLAPLAEQYLATLPADESRKEEARDLGVRTPAGVVERTVYRGLEPQARVAIVFSGELEHRPSAIASVDDPRFRIEQAEARRERFLMDALGRALNIRLREELREERGGVYGVGVGARPDRLTGTYTFSVSFGTDPERVDELVEAVYQQIALFQTEGPDADTVEKVVEADRRAEETNLRSNRFWLNSLGAAYRNREAPQDYLYSEDLRRTLTPEAIRQTASRYIDTERVVKVVLMPEAAQSE